MKRHIFPLMLIGVLLGGILPEAFGSEGSPGITKDQMIIKIGSKRFTATLANNPTATAFKAMLPLKLTMEELNGNEKVIRLSSDLPTDDSNPKNIQTGDLMIWSSRNLVLFYKSFPTSYSYTRLGRINDAEGLSTAVGSGNVTVAFELK